MKNTLREGDNHEQTIFRFQDDTSAGAFRCSGSDGSLEPPQASICLLQRSMRTGLASTGLLKKYGVKGRTIDAHAHILGGPKPAGAKTAAHDASWTELPPVTPQQRAEALKRFNRSGFDGLHFDSPEQEDLYIRKYTWRSHTVDKPRYFVDNAAVLLREMDDAGIDTAKIILLIDFAAPMRTTGPGGTSSTRLLNS